MLGRPLAMGSTSKIQVDCAIETYSVSSGPRGTIPRPSLLEKTQSQYAFGV